MQMTTNEQAHWHSHLQTPILFNHHAPIKLEARSIRHIDLNNVTATPRAIANRERVLILTPLKDAARYLDKYFDLLSELTYPHELIDLAFLVGDSQDDTLAVLSAELDRVQKRTDKIPFHSALVVEKDFGLITGQKVEERHSFAAQGPRRKAIGRARNYLLYTALKPEHSWVYWRDVDIQDSPENILEDLIDHNKDIIVPSMLQYPLSFSFPFLLIYSQIFGFIDMRMVEISRVDVMHSILIDFFLLTFSVDYNSWQESEKGLRLAASLDRDVILAEGMLSPLP